MPYQDHIYTIHVQVRVLIFKVIWKIFLLSLLLVIISRDFMYMYLTVLTLDKNGILFKVVTSNNFKIIKYILLVTVQTAMSHSKLHNLVHVYDFE